MCLPAASLMPSRPESADDTNPAMPEICIEISACEALLQYSSESQSAKNTAVMMAKCKHNPAKNVLDNDTHFLFPAQVWSLVINGTRMLSFCLIASL